MKILIPLKEFGRQGGYRVLSNLASAWVEMGHEVLMILHYSSPDPYFPTKAQIIWIDDKGNKVDRGANCFSESKKHNKYFRFFINFYALRHAVSKYGVDYNILLANSSIITPYAVYFNKLSGRKFYYVQAYEPASFVDLDEPSLFVNGRFLFDSVMWLMSSISYLLDIVKIVNSPVYLNYKILKSNYYVPPGIDFDVFYDEQNPDRSNWTTRCVTLGCIGRKEPSKGIKYVIDAFNILKKQGWNVQLSIAYGNLPSEYDLPEGATISIPRNDIELGQFYRSVDIMIAPGTIQLGAPHYPVMEAMACGIPVVTTGYIPASKDKDNSWIVPIRDTDAIVESVKEIIVDSGLRGRKLANAHNDIKDFSWEFVSAKMIDIFQSVN